MFNVKVLFRQKKSSKPVHESSLISSSHGTLLCRGICLYITFLSYCFSVPHCPLSPLLHQPLPLPPSSSLQPSSLGPVSTPPSLLIVKRLNRTLTIFSSLLVYGPHGVNTPCNMTADKI